MFDTLSEKLARTLKNLRGQGRLTEDNIKDTLREIRITLLEADVALTVAKEFIEHVKEKALGEKVMTSLQPGEALIKIVNNELTALMGETHEALDLKAQPPAIILMAGLQGSGKTTTTAKLAKLLKAHHAKSVMVTSVDIYRPAAIKQLEVLANEIGVHYHPSDASQKPTKIAKAAIDAAKKQHIDVLIVDTAGRLHVDDDMMSEIKAIHAATTPVETLFVVDSMAGQDAANTAKAFNNVLPLTGVVLTKTDGDARGGAALSIRWITGKPIKFMGTSEKLDGLEPFHPDRIASRILGMGDVLSLVEDVERKVDKKKAEKIAKKIKKGKSFDFEDFLEQLQQMRNMGGIQSLMGKIPGMNLPQAAMNQMDDSKFKQMEAIVHSMTPDERRFPEKIKKQGSRKQRIAKGSGTDIQAVNRLLKQFLQMQKMMKKLKGKGMMNMMKSMKGMMPPGGMPPGF